MALLFIFAVLILACLIGYAGGGRPERWRRWLAMAVATSLPCQVFLVMWARDMLMPGYDPASESARFGFYVGSSIAGWLTPIWFIAAVLAGRVAVKSRVNHSTSDDGKSGTS